MIQEATLNSPTLVSNRSRNSAIPTEIRIAETSRDRMAFIKMPWRIYADDSKWVPPIIWDQKQFLDPKAGPFFEHGDAKLFVAYRNGQPVGRISAHVNGRHDAIYGNEKGFFGFFECIDDVDVARALFRAAEDHLRSQGKSVVEGPYCFSIYDEIGIQVDAFETDPYLLTVHNRPYYQDLVKACGYEKSVDWYAYRADIEACDHRIIKKFQRVRDRNMAQGNVQFRAVDAGRGFRRDSTIIKSIFKQAWNRNWGHVAMSDREFDRVAEFMKLVAVPELSLIAEIDGEPVGCSLVIYDVNPTVKSMNGKLFPFGYLKLLRGVKKSNRCRLILMGMLEEYRGKGYDLGFYLHIAENARKYHFVETECSVIVETNTPLINVLNKLPGLERYKTYRIFKKDL